MNERELTQLVENLNSEVARLRADVRALQRPQGRLFVASRDDDGGFVEQIPLEDASDMHALEDGRTTAPEDDGMTLIRLKAGLAPVLAYPNGDNQAYVDLTPAGCNPDNHDIVTLGPEGEGSETADTTAFNFIAGPGMTTSNVELNVMTRCVYNHAGDQKLYGFERTLFFNCNDGNLVLQQVSSERRYEIDPPVDCS